MKSDLQHVSGYMSKWLVIATLVGVGGGLSAVLLKTMIDGVQSYSSIFPIWLTPIIGGMIVSLIYLWEYNARGHGTDLYISSVNKRPRTLTHKTLISKFSATVATLGFQGSGGVEGPMLVIGGSIADVISKLPYIKRKITKEDYRMLTICGAAGAIGAIFRSPLGGGIFVVEILYRSSLHYSDLFPSMLSSTMGFVIYSMIKDGSPMFHIPDYLPDVFNVPLFLLAGVLSGCVAHLFMFVIHRVEHIFDHLKYPNIHPILGGIATGLVLIFIPRAGGMGSSVIQSLIDAPVSMKLLILLLVGKIIATSFTTASGGSAGLVIPSLFIGAISGSMIASLIPNVDPGLRASLVITGMASCLSGIANVPISSSIMLVEMVGLKLGVPAVLGSILGFAMTHSSIIYTNDHPDPHQLNYFKRWRETDLHQDD